MTSTEFSVHMKPITQGSVTAFPIKRKNGSVGAVITHNHSNELYSLRSAIEDEYRKAGGTMAEADAHAEMLRRRKAKPPVLDTAPRDGTTWRDAP